MKKQQFNDQVDQINQIFTDLEKRLDVLEASVKHGIDKPDRSEGRGIEPATGPAGPQNGSGSAGAIAAAGVRVSQIQSQTAAEGGA